MHAIFIILLWAFVGTFSDESVRYAAVIYRHGDRTPVDPYPKDPWRDESLWPVKFGELTNLGKRQHYAHGQWLRKRYSHLLSAAFDPAEIYVRSTDVDRTLMSAEANLAGMYPPVSTAIWNPNLLWQPIPVHTIPQKQDEILAMMKPCKTYKVAMEKLVHSKAYKKRLSKYQTLMSYLTQNTGRKVNDYYGIEYIYSILKIEELYNFTLPKWTNAVYPDELKEPACYSFTTSTATPLLARLSAGPLIRQIVDNMVNSTKYCSSNSTLKMSIYSGHDNTIGSVLNAMNVFDGNCPEYTATIFMELLHDNSTSSYSVRILYRNSTKIIEPYILNIPNCGNTCPLDKFIKLYENLLTVDWEEECRQHPSVLAISFVVGVGLFIAMYIVHVIYSKGLFKHNGTNVDYGHVDVVMATPVKI